MSFKTFQKEINFHFNDFFQLKKLDYGFSACSLDENLLSLKKRTQEKKIGFQCLNEATKMISSGDSSYKSSLSHTSNLLVALVVSGSLRGVGVDIECSDRKIHPNLDSRVNQNESIIRNTLDGLDCWVIKEACYKANPDSKGSVLSQYCLVEFCEQKNEGLVQLNEVAFQVKILKTKNWKIAVALCF